MDKKKEIEHVGKIINITNLKIEVEIINKSLCASCHAKSMCSVSDAKDKIVDIPYYNNGEYSIGEEVYVAIKRSMGFKAVWISYVIPVTILLVFLLTLSSLSLHELWIGLISILAVCLYYFIIYIFRDKIANGFMFTIAKKL
ncbi:MAG: SoxR reducing system RseC family protein [Bacteroidales bacterium]